MINKSKLLLLMNQVIDNKTLDQFVQNWKIEYQSQAQNFKLFQPDTINWNVENKAKFAKLFYHIRGHYYQYLWYLGSTAPTPDYKKVILENVIEEFGQGSVSHDQLYMRFAKDCGVDIIPEILSEASNVEFIRKFNHNFLNLTLIKPWEVVWATFSAYEMLDKVDYNNLVNLVQGWELSNQGMTFFKIHAIATHYETTEELLQKIWDKNPQAVKDEFQFILENQLGMWKRLGEEF